MSRGYRIAFYPQFGALRPSRPPAPGVKTRILLPNSFADVRPQNRNAAPCRPEVLQASHSFTSSAVGPLGQNGRMAESTFSILAVCTGNICRSPAAGLLLAADLAADGRFVLSSAGTRAMTGWPISPPMAQLLSEQGISSTGFVSRQATPTLLADADLILTATLEHRDWVTGREPRALRRAFTLTEFAGAVSRHSDPSVVSPAELVAWAAGNRRSIALAGRPSASRRGYAEGDILDPYGREDAAYLRSLAQIEPLTTLIAGVLLTTE